MCHRIAIEVLEHTNSTVWVHERKLQRMGTRGNSKEHLGAWDCCVLGRPGTPYVGAVTLIREGDAVMY